MLKKLFSIFKKNQKEQSLNDNIIMMLKKCNSLNDYVETVVYLADEFSIFFEKTFKYENNEKLYILFAYMYSKFTEGFSEKLNEYELDYHNQVIYQILDRYGDGKRQWNDFIKAVDLLNEAYPSKKITQENAFFLLGTKYANFLYPELERHDIIAQSIAVSEFIVPVATLATHQKYFYNL